LTLSAVELTKHVHVAAGRSRARSTHWFIANLYETVADSTCVHIACGDRRAVSRVKTLRYFAATSRSIYVGINNIGYVYSVNVNVNVEFKVTLHEQVRLHGHLAVLKVTVCHTAGHYGEEYDD